MTSAARRRVGLVGVALVEAVAAVLLALPGLFLLLAAIGMLMAVGAVAPDPTWNDHDVAIGLVVGGVGATLVLVVAAAATAGVAKVAGLPIVRSVVIGNLSSIAGAGAVLAVRALLV